jgi:hypothetical protein
MTLIPGHSKVFVGQDFTLDYFDFTLYLHRMMTSFLISLIFSVL